MTLNDYAEFRKMFTMLSVIILNATMLNVITLSHSAECYYAQCRGIN
jgi:hypothetical protein